MKPIVRCGLAALAIALAPAAAHAAASGAAYKATLKGSGEVPAVDTQGSGTVDVTYDPSSKTLSWTGTYKDLSGPVTAAHFHGPADEKSNAGVLVPVTVTESPFSGSAPMDETKGADLTAGRVYFNIHTAKNPKGEIRGQVERTP